MKPLPRLLALALFGLVLGSCRQQPQPAWLTPVRTAAPKIVALATPARSSTATASPKGAASPAASLPTPPPLPFSPLKDGAYMYIPMKNVNLWGKWAGYYRLPQAPNVLIFVRGDNLYWDAPTHQHTLDLSFAFQVYGIMANQIATPFPPYRTEGGLTASTLHFIRQLRQIYLPNQKTLITPAARRNIALYADRNGPLSYRTPVPHVFVAVENITLSLPDNNPLRGGTLWHGKETIDCIVELDVTPGFHLQGPLRLWVPIAYYNGPPP